MSLSQLLFRYIESENNKKKKLLLLLDDDGDSGIKNPDANDNRTFGLVSYDDYPNSREYQTRKCRTLTIYNNNNNNNNSTHNSENNGDNNFNNNDHNSSLHDNRTFVLVNSDDDYPDGRVECRTLTTYNNNNKNSNINSENNDDNNFKGNNHHLLNSRADYNSALTGSKPKFDTVTERNAKNDNNSVIDSNNKKSGKKRR